MKFYTIQHQFYCGIDLHADWMYLCVIDAEGVVRLHKNIRTEPEAFLRAVKPFRDDLVVCAECMFTWYWLADLCEDEGIAFVLGHALYMRAIHGGKAKNDKIDSHKIAVLLRGGMIPCAYVYPRRMRATRDLLRRRNHLVRKRAELYAHIQNTASQYNLAEPLGRIAKSRNRRGLLARFGEGSVQKNMAVDLALIEFYDPLIKELEQAIEKTAQGHDPVVLALLRTIPGVGQILALVMLYETEDIARFPRVQDFVSYCRLVKSARESNGKKKGPSGKKIGNAHRKWAFSAGDRGETAGLATAGPCRIFRCRFTVAVHNRLTRQNRLIVLTAEIATAVTAAEAATQGQHRQFVNHHRHRCEMPRATGFSPLPLTGAVGHFAPPLPLMSFTPTFLVAGQEPQRQASGAGAIATVPWKYPLECV